MNRQANGAGGVLPEKLDLQEEVFAVSPSVEERRSEKTPKSLWENDASCITSGQDFSTKLREIADKKNKKNKIGFQNEMT